ncbi:MAG: RodZ domain-containing protein [Coriobacteriales bacterium]
MARQAFNDMLSSERRKQGLTIEQVVAATRIRAKFLIAFEEGDFSHMPPFGYAQNMIGTYARFLDLDPRVVIESFRHEYETHDFSADELDARSNLTSVSRAGRVQRRGRASGDDARRSTRPHPNSRSARSANTDAYLNRGRQRQREAERRNEDRRRHANARHIAEARSSSGRRSRQDRQGRQNLGPAQGGGSYNVFRNASPGGGRRNLVILAVLAVLLVLLVIWGISSCVNRRNSSHTTSVPTTGVVVTPSVAVSPTPSVSVTPSTAVTSAAGQPFTVSFEVAADTTSDITVTVDGAQAFQGTVAGPSTQSFTVTDQVQMTIGSPDNVTVKRNDSTIQPTISSDGTGSVLLRAAG